MASLQNRGWLGSNIGSNHRVDGQIDKIKGASNLDALVRLDLAPVIISIELAGVSIENDKVFRATELWF